MRYAAVLLSGAPTRHDQPVHPVANKKCPKVKVYSKVSVCRHVVWDWRMSPSCQDSGSSRCTPHGKRSPSFLAFPDVTRTAAQIAGAHPSILLAQCCWHSRGNDLLPLRSLDPRLDKAFQETGSFNGVRRPVSPKNLTSAGVAAPIEFRWNAAGAVTSHLGGLRP